MNEDFSHRMSMAIDRLVDGELRQDEFEQLVAALDAHPEQWRSCALAFAEAQALRRDLAGVRHEWTATAAPARKAASRTVARPAREYALLALAMAASFLLALPLGRLTAPAALPHAPNLAHHAPAIEPGTPPKSAAPSPLGQVRLMTEEGAVDWPYYSLQDGAKYLLDDQTALTPSMVEALERSGHRVVRSPGVMPVDLDNGAQVFVPVENYQITPVSNRSIQ